MPEGFPSGGSGGQPSEGFPTGGAGGQMPEGFPTDGSGGHMPGGFPGSGGGSGGGKINLFNGCTSSFWLLGVDFESGAPDICQMLMGGGMGGMPGGGSGDPSGMGSMQRGKRESGEDSSGLPLGLNPISFGDFGLTVKTSNCFGLPMHTLKRF